MSPSLNSFILVGYSTSWYTYGTKKRDRYIAFCLQPIKEWCLIYNMKKRDIYTLTLDFTPVPLTLPNRPETRRSECVGLTNREAMRRVRYAIDNGDHAGYPLRSWKIDSGWQPIESRPTQDEIDHYDSVDHY